jgi:hypothetical protein
MQIIESGSKWETLRRLSYWSQRSYVMHIGLTSLLLAATVGLGSSAYAAESPAVAAKSGAMAAHAKMGGGMMAGGMMQMGTMQCMGHSDERLAIVKAELNLTSAQLPLWNAFVETEKANAQLMRQGMGMMQSGGAGHGAHPGAGMTMAFASLPERLEQHEKMMTAHLDALRKMRAAVSPLYDALTPDQRFKADGLLCASMNNHGPASHKGSSGPADHHP